MIPHMCGIHCHASSPTMRRQVGRNTTIIPISVPRPQLSRQYLCPIHLPLLIDTSDSTVDRKLAQRIFKHCNVFILVSLSRHYSVSPQSL